MKAVRRRAGDDGEVLGKTTHETNPDAEAKVRRLIKQQSPAAIRAAIHRMMHRPDPLLLGQVTVPTLVITGEEDELIPVDESRADRRRRPGAKLVIFPRRASRQTLKADAFNPALNGFLVGYKA